MSCAALPAVLRRQPRLLVRMPLPLLKARAAALRDLLGCCAEEQEGEQEEAAEEKCVDSSSNSSGDLQGAGSKRSSPADEPDAESEGNANSNGIETPHTESDGNANSSGSKRREYPPVSLSHVLSVVPCLWCYKVDTTR